MTPLRILMTTDTVGGVWTYALELASALEGKEVEIGLATMGDPLTPDQAMQAARLPHVQLYESKYKLEWMENPWDDVAEAGEWLLALEQELKPNLVHLNNFAHGSLEWERPCLVVGHSCVLSWWRAVHKEEAPGSWRTYRQAVSRGLQAADAVVAPSRAMLASMLSDYGPFKTQRVIPNGRTMPSISRSKEPFVLSAGRLWDAAKNVGTLSAIASELPWPVCVAGSVAEPGRFATSFRNVELLGKLPAPEMAHWFSRAAIYALPARYEPFGLSILEAALSECALVLGDIPSLREYWDGAALLVCPENRDQLKDSLLEVISHPPLRRSLAARALERAEALSTERFALAYLDLYRQLQVPHDRFAQPLRQEVIRA